VEPMRCRTPCSWRSSTGAVGPKGRSAIWASVRVPRTSCSGEALVRAHP